MDPIRRSVALVMVMLAPAASLAQPASRPAESEEPIPRELALALLNMSPGPAGTDIRVGKAPEDVPPELIPPGLQILGSTTQFENAVIVLVAPQQPDSAIAALEAHLLKAGWTKPPMPTPRAQRGFISADAGQFSYSPSDMVCRGDEFVMLSGSYRRAGGSVVKVAYNRGRQYSACKQREQAQMQVARNPYDEAPVPLLRAPQGSMQTPEGGGGMSSIGSNGITLSTRFRTRLKPAEVAAHYDKQMRDQGWTPISDGAVEMIAARSYKKTDDKDATWTAVLVSMTTPETSDQNVSLRLDRKR
jgi:hypothetical protein